MSSAPLRADSAESSSVLATQPLLRVVFAQHMMKWAPHSTRRLIELGFVCSVWNDTVCNYGEAVLDCWKRSSDEAKVRAAAERAKNFWGNEEFALCVIDISKVRNSRHRDCGKQLSEFEQNFERACERDVLNLVPQFLAVGAEPGSGPLCAAAEFDRRDAFDTLLAAKPTTAALDHVLPNLADYNRLALVERILALGASCTKPLFTPSFTGRSAGGSALKRACQRGHLDMVRALLGAGASWAGALLFAAQGNNVDIVKLILARMGKAPRDDEEDGEQDDEEDDDEDDVFNDDFNDEVNVDAQHPEDNTTPLMEAAENGSVEIIQLLLAAGARVNGVKHCEPPLHVAARAGQACSIRALFAAGARDCSFGEEGWTALTTAVRCTKLGAVEALLLEEHESVIIDHITKCEFDDACGGGSALMIACALGELEIAKELIQAGAAVQLADDQGMTPLHFAAARGKADCVAELLRLGASTDAEDSEGCTAVELAMEYDHEDCVELLLPLDDGAGSRRSRSN